MRRGDCQRSVGSTHRAGRPIVWAEDTVILEAYRRLVCGILGTARSRSWIAELSARWTTFDKHPRWPPDKRFGRPQFDSVTHHTEFESLPRAGVKVVPPSVARILVARPLALQDVRGSRSSRASLSDRVGAIGYVADCADRRTPAHPPPVDSCFCSPNGPGGAH